MSEQLNRIEDMVSQLIKIVGETNSKVDRIEKKVDEVVGSQERHERLLEVLSKRSLVQESYIDDFKHKR